MVIVISTSAVVKAVAPAPAPAAKPGGAEEAATRSSFAAVAAPRTSPFMLMSTRTMVGGDGGCGRAGGRHGGGEDGGLLGGGVDGWRDGLWRILQKRNGSKHGVSGQRRRMRVGEIGRTSAPR